MWNLDSRVNFPNTTKISKTHKTSNYWALKSFECEVFSKYIWVSVETKQGNWCKCIALQVDGSSRTFTLLIFGCVICSNEKHAFIKTRIFDEGKQLSLDIGYFSLPCSSKSAAIIIGKPRRGKEQAWPDYCRVQCEVSLIRIWSPTFLYVYVFWLCFSSRRCCFKLLLCARTRNEHSRNRLLLCSLYSE